MSSQQFSRMPPPSGVASGPIHPPTQQQQQQQRRLDPEMMPSPVRITKKLKLFLIITNCIVICFFDLSLLDPSY